MDLSVYCFRDDSFPASQLAGQNTGVLLFDAVAQVYAVFSQRKVESDVSMLSASTVTTAWCVLRLRIEETASRYGG
jgi:hypothetical protein